MREKNIITPIIFVIFLVVISNLTTISIATQFDWALFVVSLQKLSKKDTSYIKLLMIKKIGYPMFWVKYNLLEITKF